MKIQQLIVIIGAALIFAGCATTPEQKLATTPLPGEEVVLTVYGLSCPLCSNNLDGQLYKIDGIEHVAIDLDTGAVNIRMAEGHTVTEQQLASAVKAAGFTLAEINSTETEE